jgi:hypothetical protein
MSNPLFNTLGGGAHPGQDNDPQFMRMVSGLNKFRSQLHGDPEQMVMDAVRSGRISQQQLDRVQSMATKIQRMMTGMGL